MNGITHAVASDTNDDMTETYGNMTTSQGAYQDLRNGINLNQTDATINDNLYTNHLQQLLQSIHNGENTNNDTGLNFVFIAQYILQAYFKVTMDDLQNINLCDLIVDQTYAESLTLRKLGDSILNKSYNSQGRGTGSVGSGHHYTYYNTVTRDPNVSKCPIFSLAIYFVIKFNPNQSGHATSNLSIQNYNSITLLDPNYISSRDIPNNIKLTNIALPSTQITANRIPRSAIDVPQALLDMVFPWLSSFKNDISLYDRTNYKLNSLVELFEYFAKVVVQDLRCLLLQEDSGSTIPNIAGFVSKLLPNLFQDKLFISFTNLGARTKRANIEADEASSTANDSFTSLSQRLTKENIRLNQQITSLKNELQSVNAMCNEILELQRQAGLRQNSGENNNGIVILDRNTMNSSLINTLIQLTKDKQYTTVEHPHKRSLPYNDTFNDSNNYGETLFKKYRANNGALSGNHVALSPRNLGRITEHDIRAKATPSQTALHSLLSNSISSPRQNTPVAAVNNMQSGNNIKGNNPPFDLNESSSLTSTTTSASNTPLEINSKMGANESRYTDANSISRENNPVTNISVNAQSPSNNIVSSMPMSLDEELSPRSTTKASSTFTEQESNENTISNSISSDQPNGENNGQTQSSEQATTELQLSKAKSGKRSYILNGVKHGPNEDIKYKLSRDNKTVWDLYTEWYIGLNGNQSVTELIRKYGWRRWKVHKDSHFFPTRRIIMDYIEEECDRGIKLGRFRNANQSREDIRKILVGDLEKFRINNGLTLNSLSLYFKSLTKNNAEICIFDNFETWSIKQMSDEEKRKYCKRKHRRRGQDSPSAIPLIATPSSSARTNALTSHVQISTPSRDAFETTYGNT